ncbi:MAG: hypothetical protein H6678_00745 [Candidatus Delongbacteria bacterium]|nr:hypothetical protein [Candidatus Cloacimonadota bacterium]MCB9472319.1 hypothetical protein [Candidatus Delongbacteria bacterium]
MTHTLKLVLCAPLWALLAGSALADSWQRDASDFVGTATFRLPAGDTLVVQGDDRITDVDLDMIDWSRGGRLVLRDLVIRDSGSRASTFPIVLGENQELLLDNTRIDCTSSMFVVDGAQVESTHSTLSSMGTVFETIGPATVLNLSDTRFGASGTALETSCGELDMENCVFLTNDRALVASAEAQVVIRDCLFQANDVAIEIDGDQIPLLINVDIVDSRHWDLINHISGQPVNLEDVYLSTGDLSKVQGAVLSSSMPQAPRHTVYEAQGPLLIPGTVVVGELPLTILPVGVTSVDMIPCRESRYLIYLSEHPYVFPSEPTAITTTPVYTFPNQTAGARLFVRVVAELGRWE